MSAHTARRRPRHRPGRTRPRTLAEYDLVDAVKACERQIAHLHATQAHLIRELSTRDDYATCGDNTQVASF